MKAKSVLFCSLLAAAAASAHAESGFYVLGAVGQSHFDYNLDSEDLKGTEDGVTIAEATGKQDKSDTGFKLQVGYQINDNFAIEGGYVDLGEYSLKGSLAGDVNGDDFEGVYKAKAKSTAINLDGVFILPLGSDWSLFAKVGVVRAETKQSLSLYVAGEGGSDSSKKTRTTGHYGLGGAYNLTKDVSVRLEWERFNQLGSDDLMGKANVDLFSLGIAYHL